MDKGEIIEQGCHEELLEQKGEYYKLWEMQQGNFVIYEETKEELVVDISEEDEDGTISYT